jgi:DNA-binding LacI/PurR family transcriptional regulator
MTRNFRPRLAPMTSSSASTERRTTIADVAREAGVSVPTVSKVINGRRDVSAETRRRVEDVISSIGYRPIPRAGGRSDLLEVVFHELESEWALEIVMGVEEAARAHHMAVVITEMHGRRTPGRDWVEGVVARRPVGLVVVFTNLSAQMRAQLHRSGIPFVVVDPTGEPVHDTPSVGATNWSGGVAATRHLIGLGHSRIGVITGPSEILCSRARLDGYRAAMDAAGLRVDEALVRHGDFHVASGERLARAMLRLPDPPTAIVAGNDLMALGVYQAARDFHLRIPEQLSVVGFDDLPVASWVSPPLTTVRQPLAAMASAATRLVLELARGEAPAQTRFELSTDLVVRESTARPAAAPAGVREAAGSPA